MLTSHISFLDKEKAVSIWLPKSKTDQRAAGVRRTLACCGKKTCLDLCPWRLACKVLKAARKKGFFGSTPLFLGDKFKAVTKAGFVNAWKDMFGDDVSGHSPRRSGAMYYVRAGLPIQELAFLGRWRSSVVLCYAEEALQEKPMRAGHWFTPEEPKKVAVQHLQQLSHEESGREECTREPNPKEDLAASEDKVKKTGDAAATPIASAFDSPKDLWVITKGRGSKARPAHRVTKACWSLPIKEWSTACGWLFADKSAEASFILKLKPDQAICNTCKNMGLARQVHEVKD